MGKHSSTSSMDNGSPERKEFLRRNGLDGEPRGEEVGSVVSSTKSGKIISVASIILGVVMVVAIVAGIAIFAHQKFSSEDEETNLEEDYQAFQDAKYKGGTPELIGGGTDFATGTPVVKDASGAFVFADSDTTADNIKDKKVVDVYMTFGGEKSSSLFLNSIDAFKGAVSEGKFVLVVHPIFTDDDSSKVMAEGMAVVAHEQPDFTWQYFEQTLSLSSLYTSSDFSPELIVDSTAQSVQNAGVTGFDKTRLLAGSRTFEPWFSAAQEESKAKVGDYIPAVFVDGNKIDEKNVNALNTNELFKAIGV